MSDLDVLREWLDRGQRAQQAVDDLVGAFRCPRCGAVSHHPSDVAEGYCGRCHDWTRE